jgi:hypothetical protein
MKEKVSGQVTQKQMVCSPHDPQQQRPECIGQHVDLPLPQDAVLHEGAKGPRHQVLAARHLLVQGLVAAGDAEHHGRTLLDAHGQGLVRGSVACVQGQHHVGPLGGLELEDGAVEEGGLVRLQAQLPAAVEKRMRREKWKGARSVWWWRWWWWWCLMVGAWEGLKMPLPFPLLASPVLVALLHEPSVVVHPQDARRHLEDVVQIVPRPEGEVGGAAAAVEDAEGGRRR